MAGRSVTVAKIGNELADALKIRAALAEHDDPVLILDMIEGSTELHEAILVVFEENIQDQAMVAAIEKQISDLTARKQRLTKSIEGRESIILSAMEKAGVQTIKGAIATLTVKATPPKLEVVDEAAIPARFWKQPDPTLDKRALNEAVKDGEIVPGVQKTNGGITLQVRGS